MKAFSAANVTQRTIILVLASGFALVILLLLAASVVSLRNGRLVQQSVAGLIQEQLVMSRLVTEMQVQQATLNAVFFQISSEGESMDRAALLQQLEDTEKAFRRILAVSEGTPEEGLWRDLSVLAEEFSDESSKLMSGDTPSGESLTAVLQAHEAALPIVAKLIASGSAKSASLQTEIESQSRHLVTQSFLFLAPGVAIALIFALLTVKIASELYHRMRWQAEELSRVSFHMLQGQEVIARRFSHELHDELGQSLTAVKANLVALTPDNLAERRSDCLHVVDESISNVSELSQLLRPVILDDLGLDAGLRWLTDKFTQRTNIEVSYVSDSAGRLPEDLETHLFRIAQEALTNVARHSQATRVNIELSQTNGRIHLKIADNGRGLQPANKTVPGLGLFGMRARAENAGGQLKLISSPGGGVSIDVSVPRERTTPSGAEETTHPAG